MKLFFSLSIAALAVPATTLAYLEPQEVFTDLEVPEVQEATQENSRTWVAEPSENTAPTQAPPSFFRAGEQLKTKEKTAEQVEPKTQIPDSPFEALEEEPVVEEEPVEEVVEEPVEEAVEEPVVEEEEEEVATKPAAGASGSMVLKLVKRLLYPVAGILIAGFAFFYFFKGKKKPASASAAVADPSLANEAPVQAPDNPQKTEESSPRLEHALEAMNEEASEDDATPSA